MNFTFKGLKSQSHSNLPEIKNLGKSETPTLKATKNSFSWWAEHPTCSTPNLNKLPEIKLFNGRRLETTQTMPQILLTDRQIPRLNPSAVSISSCGKVRAYAANTHQGLTRIYNEDKAMIILKIKNTSQPNKKIWQECSFFGLYDGHGGKACSNFLRDNLHHYIINDHFFPESPKQAILRGFAQAETDFLNVARDTGEKSGSCALVVIILGKICYVANLGDSRAVMSGSHGQQVFTITRDHKPNDPDEQERIQQQGGKIYSNSPSKIYRIIPGRLSVSRSFGDIDAKNADFGGNPNVLIATPEIKSFKIKKHHDFIMMGCDGIFDVMSSKDVVSTVWDSNENAEDLASNSCRNAVEAIITQSMKKRSNDNLTAIIIAFDSFENCCTSAAASKKLMK